MTVREAFEAAAPRLREFEAALRLGRLVICGQCGQFTFDRDPEHLGHCARFDVEAHPFIPFQCAGFGRRQRRAA